MIVDNEVAPEEALSTLLHRGNLMTEIIEKPTQRKNLYRRLDQSRSTVYRGLEQLEECGFVVEVAGNYEVTPVGKFVFENYERFVNIIQLSSKYKDLIDPLYSDTESLPSALLQDADILYSEEYIPAKLLGYVQEMIRDSTTMRGFISDCSPELFNEVFNQINDECLIGSMVMSEDLFGFAAEHADGIPQSEEFELYRTDQLPKFTLLLSKKPNKRLVVVVFDGKGGIQGIIDTQNVPAYFWGLECFKFYKDMAKQY